MGPLLFPLPVLAILLAALDSMLVRLEHTLTLQLQMVDVDLNYVFLTRVYALPLVLPPHTDWKAHEHRRVNQES